MKSLVLFCLVAGGLGAAPKQLQPPRQPPARVRSQSFEIVPTTEPSAEPTTDSIAGPYPPSGWKPAGATLALPAEQAATSAPYMSSGWMPTEKPFGLPRERSPSTTYGSADVVYGVHDDSSKTPTTDAPVTDIPEKLQVEKIEGPVEVLRSISSYFVLQPDELLQRLTAGGRARPRFSHQNTLALFGR